jgi:dipeptidyl aminopeptidase/acylaminoacyl peptidase
MSSKVAKILSAVFLALLVAGGGVYRFAFGTSMDDWKSVGPPIADGSAVPAHDVIIDVVWGDAFDIGVASGIYLVDAKTGAFARWSHDLPNRSIDSLRYAPKERLLFWKDGDGHVNTTDLDGKTSAAPPASDYADRIARAISPAGDRVAAEHDRRVEVSGLDGSAPLVLMTDQPDVLRLAWSPKGDAITALVRSKENRLELWILGLDRTQKKIDVPMGKRSRIDSLFGNDDREGIVASAWSPEGDRLALLVDRDGPCWNGGRDQGAGCFASIYVVQRDGSGLRRMSKRHQARGELLWPR